MGYLERKYICFGYTVVPYVPKIYDNVKEQVHDQGES